MDSAIRMGVNVRGFSANQTPTGALAHGDSSRAGPASNRGTSVGKAPLEGTGPEKWEEFVESLTQTTP